MYNVFFFSFGRWLKIIIFLNILQLFTKKILFGFSHVFRRLEKVLHCIDFSDKDTKNKLMEPVHHKTKG